MSESNLIGQQIGRYELREVLGVGGMAVVYRAHQSAPLNRDVALKIVSATLSQNPGYVERFVREAETAASLEHQHIVPIYDFGVDNSAPYIVMRLLPGGSLAERMAHFIQSEGLQPSLGEIATVLQQVASALDYAHSRGVLHRDVKPSNVMFDQQGSAYLLDFGIAKLLEATGALTGTGMSMGTPSYMSPEQWRADELSPATDQYALGAMAYALVTGMPPFDAPTPYAWMHKHLNEMPTPAHLRASHVPEALSSVLERAMAKNPVERFESVTAFAQAFGRAVRGQEGEPTGFFTKKLPKRRITVPTHPSGSASHPRTPTTLPEVPIYRRPVVWGAGIAALIVAILAILLLQPGESGDSVDRAVGQTLTAVAIANAPAEKPQGPIVEVIDPSPTALSATPTPLPTDTPISETDTARTLDAEIAALQTAQQQTLDAQSSQTAAAWTDTPTLTLTATPDLPATAAHFATLTQQARNQQSTQHAQAQTLTAAAWTATPSATATLTVTPTITHTPTATATRTPTATQTTTLTPTVSVAPASDPLTIVNQLSYFQIISADNAVEVMEQASFSTNSRVSGITMSSDNKLLASGSTDGLTVWEISSGEKVLDINGSNFEGVDFSADNTMLAYATLSDEVVIVNVKTGQTIRRFANRLALSVEFSPDNSLLASGGCSELKVWEVSTGQQLYSFEDAQDCVNGVSFSSDGSLLAFGSADSVVRVVATQDFSFLTSIEAGYPIGNGVSFSPGVEILAYSDMVSDVSDDVVFWDIDSGKEILKFGDQVMNFAFDPTGSILATSGYDGWIRLWDVNSGTALAEFQGHYGDAGGYEYNYVTDVEFSKDGTLMASGGFDGTVRLWGVVASEENGLSSWTATSDALAFARNPVTHNADWTPVVQEFDGVEMVLVPAGCFDMGSLLEMDEDPIHQVCFTEPFWIDRTEVSNAEFSRFEGDAQRNASFPDELHPRENATWAEADTFCRQRGGRLPTEAEWEYAARGPDGWAYPWGDEFDSRLGNFDDEVRVDVFVVQHGAGSDGFDTTSPVGSFPEGASWVGALNLSGNVWEWVQDWYAPDYYDELSKGMTNPTGPESGQERVLRGGSWGIVFPGDLVASERGFSNPGVSNEYFGFRCARPAVGTIELTDDEESLQQGSSDSPDSIDCTVTASKTVNMRSGPGTNYPVMNSLGAGDTLPGIGKAVDASGYTWWLLDNNAWVRSDIVSYSPDCEDLPES